MSKDENVSRTLRYWCRIRLQKFCLYKIAHNLGMLFLLFKVFELNNSIRSFLQQKLILHNFVYQLNGNWFKTRFTIKIQNTIRLMSFEPIG